MSPHPQKVRVSLLVPWGSASSGVERHVIQRDATLALMKDLRVFGWKITVRIWRNRDAIILAQRCNPLLQITPV